MKRKPHPNHKKYAFVANIDERNRNTYPNLSFAYVFWLLFCGMGLFMGLGLFYQNIKKIPVYQNGELVDMRVVEKNILVSSMGRIEKSIQPSENSTNCTLKLYYDGQYFYENGSIYQYCNYAVGDYLPRRFLKGNPIVLEPDDTLVIYFVISIFMILFFGTFVLFITRQWYKSRM